MHIYSFIQLKYYCNYGNKANRVPTPHQQNSESSKDYFIGLWEDHVGSTKAWEGRKLIH